MLISHCEGADRFHPGALCLERLADHRRTDEPTFAPDYAVHIGVELRKPHRTPRQDVAHDVTVAVRPEQVIDRPLGRSSLAGMRWV
jgi:hypothetical protein